MARVITGRQAFQEALYEEFRHDPKTLYYGEDVAKFGGVFGATAGLVQEFGPERVFDTPVAETTLVGAALGLAITGMRPVVELQFADFVGIAMDELAHKLGKWRYMHGGEFFEVPVTVILPTGIGGGAGPEHSQSPYAPFLHFPGLYIVIPSSPADIKGLLKSSIRNNNPCLYFIHKFLMDVKGEVPDGEYTVPLGEAHIVRPGKDVTLIALSYMVTVALEAAERLARDGIEAEVVDPRTLCPLDKNAILNSVRKTGRVVIVHEEQKTGGSGAELAAIIAEEALYDLQAPIKRLGAPDVPIAQSIYLEQFYRPSVDQIISAVKEIV
ncbi:MAG: alpha-ketoacid dehydrogenase subunit beta [Alicyclobacillus sp.]|nr:alpha-ketoacid dehydrogenase subunit beta [Alicyclobacillus sp.]